ncbi:MAG: rod shape-determining protein RodA [Kordiimonadales bacterium]|nr:MAG: rod shape-determining protein RodA [Kordiimonadales bacterium]
MNTFLRSIAVTALLVFPFSASADDATPSTEGAKVYFIFPADGAKISGPVTVRFGLKGMGVAPSGIEKAGTGHHHLIVDAPLPSVTDFIPADEHHKHFGGGQTEVTLTLAPGKHTLQLLLGDQSHLPHVPAVYSKKITITVE